MIGVATRWEPWRGWYCVSSAFHCILTTAAAGRCFWGHRSASAQVTDCDIPVQDDTGTPPMEGISPDEGGSFRIFFSWNEFLSLVL